MCYFSKPLSTAETTQVFDKGIYDDKKSPKPKQAVLLSDIRSVEMLKESKKIKETEAAFKIVFLEDSVMDGKTIT